MPAVLTSRQKAILRRELAELYLFYQNKVKEVVTSAEKIDSEQRLSIASSIEVRAAFDHVSKVEAAIAKGNEKHPEIKTRTQLFEYCHKHADKAHGHLYRAAYDAYDAIAYQLVEDINKQLLAVSQQAFYEVIDKAHERVSVPLAQAAILTTKGKMRKDVANKRDEEDEFQIYEKATTQLYEIKELVGSRMDAMLKYDKDVNKRGFFSMANWTTIVGIIIGVIVTVLVTWVTIGYSQK
jgi:hypothetical protein